MRRIIRIIGSSWLAGEALHCTQILKNIFWLIGDVSLAEFRVALHCTAIALAELASGLEPSNFKSLTSNNSTSFIYKNKG